MSKDLSTSLFMHLLDTMDFMVDNPFPNDKF